MATIEQDGKSCVGATTRFNERKSPVKSRLHRSAGVNQSEVLIEGEFIELDDQLWLDKQVRILVTSELVYLTEHGSEQEINSQAHVLQHGAGKTVLKFHRADINIELLEGCSYTFRAKWTKADRWRTYRLCGNLDTWRKWLRCFHLQRQQQCGFRLRESGSEFPSIAVAESEDDDLSSSSGSDDEGEEIAMPNRVSLCVDRAMSMLSMTMLNPSNVRRIAISNLQHLNSLKRPSLGTIGSENEDVFDSCNAGELFRSSSHPRLSDTKPFCTFSLMNVAELDNVRIDQDLKQRSTNDKLSNGDSMEKRDIKTKPHGYRTNSRHQNCSAAEVVLQNRIENLRSHPSNLNFVRRDLWNKTLSLSSPAHNRRLSLSLALTSDTHRIPQSAENIIKVSPARNGVQQTESVSAPNNTTHPRPSSPHTTGHPAHRAQVARRLDFKDDLDIELSDQKPQKAKVRRFWTILQKRRPRTGPSFSEIEEDSAKELRNNLELGSNADSAEHPPLRRGKSFSGVIHRGKCTDNGVGRSDGKRNKLLERGSTSRLSFSTSPTRNKQDSISESPFSRKWSTPGSSGSVKKKFVQKILSPILKSTSLEENIGGGRVSSPTELQLSPLPGCDRLLNGGLPQGLIDIDALTFAHEISLIDKELFVRILWHELETCGWMTKDKYVRSPNVMEMVEFFNRVAMLVASEILAEETPQARARVVSKVIQIADKCRLIGNYNTLKALMAGLQSAPIFRLKETWKEVSSKRKKKFRDLSITMGESDNFALYRSELASCLAHGPCLPFLGDFLTQIAQTQAFLAVKRKKQTVSPVTEDCQESVDSVDGVTRSNCNGVTSRDEPNSCPTTPRAISPDVAHDTTPVTCTSVLSRSSRRGSTRSKFKRLYSRQHSVDGANNSADPLDCGSSAGFRGKLMPASSDSVISGSSTESWRTRTPGSRPPLLRRLSESAYPSTPTSFSGKPKRRMSESAKSSKTRRFFFDGFVRRSTSSSSVKDGRAGRGSDRLGHSFSTQSIQEGSVMDEDTLGKSVSTPVIKDGMSRDVSRDFSRDVSRNASREGVEEEEGRESLVKSAEAYHAGTESQLLQYQMAAIQYDYPSRAEVRQYLLNASFNTEEENYKLSLKREPPVKTS